MTALAELKTRGEAPEHLTDEGFKTLSNGYLLDGETPVDMYRRVARAASRALKRVDLEHKFYDYIYKGWLCLATPVASNMGTERGLPISCYSMNVPDSVDGIFKTVHELSMLSKNGGGVAFCVSGVRGRGAPIKGNGCSEGIIPWLKCFDSTTIAVSQGSVRRGASAAYLDVNHTDIEEFIRIRRPTGDVNRQCLNIHHGVCVDDKFMQAVESGEKRQRDIFKEILKTRFETGEPYIMYIDNVNRANPEAYKKNGLEVRASNICSEITLYTDDDHSFVCCISSLNLTKFDEWKNTDLVETSIWFLDAVMTEFIEKARNIPGFERAIRFAEKSRALGIGALGWHSYLQSKMIPIDSLQAKNLNKLIFKTIRDKADIATKQLAEAYGEPEWCKGTGRRNTHLIAIAPTVSNSTISGNVSPGIEPIPANAFTKKSAKGSFVQKNPLLEKLLEARGKNDEKTWKTIVNDEGSVQSLPFLSKEEKEVFLTAREINQMELVRQAADRQKYIDQSQSLNLFFPVNVDPKWFYKIHVEAWKLGIKTLYYTRTGSVLKGDVASRFYESECKACEG